MNLGLPILNKPPETDMDPPLGAVQVADPAEQLVDIQAKPTPHIHSVQSDTSDAATITVSDEEFKPTSKVDHQRLTLLSQVVRLLDERLVYYRNQSLWVYLKDELKSLTKMVLHPIETMFCGLRRKLQCSPSEIKNFKVGSFPVTSLISDDGAHGLVVTCTDHDKRLYAMKIERGRREMSADVNSFAEISFHPSTLACNDLRIPRLRQIFSQYRKEVVVMECLGPDLGELRRAQGWRPFNLKTVYQVAVSLLTAYEQIHNTGWLHLTPKPWNFCIGGTSQTKHKIYIVDFRRAQRYMECDDYWNLCHRKFKQRGDESPQAEAFQSVWGEKGNVTFRRDDIMSLSLALLAMCGYWSPWEKSKLAREKWIRSLGWGFERTMIRVFDEMLVYSLNMRYEEAPAYESWRERIRKFANDEGVELDGKFDWDERICEDDNGRIVLKKVEEAVKKEEKERKKSKLSREKRERKRKREMKKAAKKEAGIKNDSKIEDSDSSSSTSTSSSGMDAELEAMLSRGLCGIL